MSDKVSNSLKLDVIYNYLSTLIVMLVPILAIKYYLNNYGVAKWGVISFVILIQIFLGVFDAGMGQVLIREFSSRGNKAIDFVFVRNVEKFYFYFSVLVFFIIFVFGVFLIDSWIRVGRDLGWWVLLTGAVLFVMQIYSTLYKSFLVGKGFQRQVAFLNMLQILILHCGGVLLSFFAEGIQWFFLWMIFSAIFVSGLRRYMVVRRIVYEERVSYSCGFELKDRYLKCFKMAFSVSIGVALTHVDKLILSSLLDIESFGLYMIAANLSIGVVQFVYPVGQSLLPHLVRLKDDLVLFKEKIRIFFLINMSVSVCGTLVFLGFGRDLTELWLGEQGGRVYPVLAVMIIGTAMAPIGEVFYNIWIVFGATKYIFVRNLVSIIFVVAGLQYVIHEIGVVGAGFGWVFTNIVTLIVGGWSCFLLFGLRMLRPKKGGV